MREIFADHDLIEGLGCGSIIHVPVIADGRTLGVLNILDAEATYDDDAVVVAESLAPPAVSALLNLEKENR
ncbi:GAF domain-containing protein [Streptomyces sp. NBC_00285]|uniref:GAF domain-containing protein n=1 Tax=Streptomyces sp. NBC_00285 TaxID=2975700 RepID=UPI002E2B6B8F|nr:GAF domain-containing protein [Streptomyces sp. NBC_00285]